MAFFQAPPELGNQYQNDRDLRAYLARTLPADMLRSVEPEFSDLGELAGGALYRAQLEDRHNEPRLVQWDAWGNRVDRIELTSVWQHAARLAAERGLVATAWERKHGALSRVHQFALVYLFDASTDTYSCPLAMTDGAVATLLTHKSPLTQRAVPHLTSRDPAKAWTSGQWMTERTGGSDVGLSEAQARPAGEARELYGVSGAHRLHGTKWFTSAATSDMALTLARPLGSPAGGRGLTLFYLETRDENGEANYIAINRLKEKLGTRKLPTAELSLEGALAVPVAGIGHGIRNIAPMLNVTRTWNAVCSVAAMRRGIALACDYAARRVQFGAPLIDKPLHVDTLAGLRAEHAGAFALAFRVVELLGRSESGEASDDEKLLLRLLTPIAKLLTAKQTVSTLSECLECFGGAGYVEDTGLPRLLRDAQVLPIWEGTTNVLSLDLLRAVSQDSKMGCIERELDALAANLKDAKLKRAADDARAAFDAARAWRDEAASRSRGILEAGARRFAFTLGRAVELALLCHHADWCLQNEHGEYSKCAALRFQQHGVSRLASGSTLDDAYQLVRT